MVLFDALKKHSVILYLTAALAMLLCLMQMSPEAIAVITEDDTDWQSVMDAIFSTKNDTLLTGNADRLKAMYVDNERNSRLAAEAETSRYRYLRSWSERQGVVFKSIRSKAEVRQKRRVGRGFAFYVMVSTEFAYAYEDDPETENVFRIGTYHSLDLIPGKQEGTWLISREWYLDPFQDSLQAKGLNAGEVKEYVLAQKKPDYQNLPERRLKAITYADHFAGAASNGEFGYKYNTEYPNYNHRGGDCSNYISQALHEGGGFRKGGGWNCDRLSATHAWCNASGLKNFLVYSGKASVTAKGPYSQIYKTVYKLVPGDIVAYEEKGKVVHMAMVTAVDSKGYPLVNTHTTDRYHVPWDLGWNDDDIRFFLMKVHYPS
jgi:hypothetical protein